jgi:uncharacterized membrane protein
MSLPTSETIPDEANNLPPARRRRDRRKLSLLGTDEHAEILDELGNETSPSFDFFLFSLVCGAILGLGILTDSPAFFFLAVLLAPFMAPMFGLSLAIIVGTGRYFLRTLASTLLGGLLVFTGSGLIGLIPRVWHNSPFNLFTQAPYHARLNWPDFFVLTLGIVLTTITMVRAEQKPLIYSAIVTYGLYIPLGTAGFGLSSGVAHLWPDGLAIFTIYLTWAIILGALILRIMGFRLMTRFGYFMGGVILFIGLIIFIGLVNFYSLVVKQVEIARVAPTSTSTPTSTITITLTPTETPAPPTQTNTPTHSLIPTLTITPTLAPSATLVWALVDSSRGAVIRAEPKSSAKIVAYVLDGSLLKAFPDTAKESGVVWVHVVTNKGVEGWIVQILLKTATPAPAW